MLRIPDFLACVALRELWPPATLRLTSNSLQTDRMTEIGDKKSDASSSRPRRWRQWLTAAGIVLVLLLARPAWHLLSTAWNDSEEI
jgi:hypothetical protein